MSSTPLPESFPGRRRSRLWLALTLAAISVGALALTFCTSTDSEPQTIEILVPFGTDERLKAGEDVVLMPQRLELRVGDTLFIRNHDEVTHSVGPYTVEANTETRFVFGKPGRYEGYCPVSEGDRYEIVVTA